MSDHILKKKLDHENDVLTGYVPVLFVEDCMHVIWPLHFNNLQFGGIFICTIPRKKFVVIFRISLDKEITR